MIDRFNFSVLRTALGLQARLADRLRRDEGQTFVEYALVLTLVVVAVLVVGAFTGLANKIIDALDNATNTIGSHLP